MPGFAALILPSHKNYPKARCSCIFFSSHFLAHFYCCPLAIIIAIFETSDDIPVVTLIHHSCLFGISDFPCIVCWTSSILSLLGSKKVNLIELYIRSPLRITSSILSLLAWKVWWLLWMIRRWFPGKYPVL